MKFYYRLLQILVCTILLSCIVFVANADHDADDDIIIDGTWYNTKKFVSDVEGKGWKWIVKENKLVLNGYNGGEIRQVQDHGLPLLVEIQGQNTIDISDGRTMGCIYPERDVKLIGDGSITFRCTDIRPIVGYNSHGILTNGGSVVIDGNISCKFEGLNSAIVAQKNLHIKNAKAISIVKCEDGMAARKGDITIDNIDTLKIEAINCLMIDNNSHVDINSKSNSIYLHGTLKYHPDYNDMGDDSQWNWAFTHMPISHKNILRIKHKDYYNIERLYKTYEDHGKQYLMKLVLTPKSTPVVAVPKTGDSNKPILYGMLMSMSLAIVALLVSKKTKIRN